MEQPPLPEGQLLGLVGPRSFENIEPDTYYFIKENRRVMFAREENDDEHVGDMYTEYLINTGHDAGWKTDTQIKPAVIAFRSTKRIFDVYHLITKGVVTENPEEDENNIFGSTISRQDVEIHNGAAKSYQEFIDIVGLSDAAAQAWPTLPVALENGAFVMEPWIMSGEKRIFLKELFTTDADAIYGTKLYEPAQAGGRRRRARRTYNRRRRVVRRRSLRCRVARRL